MQIETLKVFIDLVNFQSFSLAAERNYITQSAVSQQINTLEQKFKRRLIERVRGKNNVRLTPAGEIFYDHSKNLLNCYTLLNDDMNGLTGKISGTLKVSVINSVGLYELNDKIKSFINKFPIVKLDIEYARYNTIVRNVLSDTIDLGIIAFADNKKNLTSTAIHTDQLVLISAPGHSILNKKKLTFSDLNKQDFIFFDSDTPTGKAIEKTLKSNNVDVNKVGEFNNIETIKQFVAVSSYLGIVPKASITNELKAEQLNMMELPKQELWERPISIINRSNKPLSVAAKKFIGLISSIESAIV